MKTAHVFLQIGLILATVGFTAFAVLIIADHARLRRRRERRAWRQSGGGRL